MWQSSIVHYPSTEIYRNRLKWNIVKYVPSAVLGPHFTHCPTLLAPHFCLTFTHCNTHIPAFPHICILSVFISDHCTVLYVDLCVQELHSCGKPSETGQHRLLYQDFTNTNQNFIRVSTFPGYLQYFCVIAEHCFLICNDSLPDSFVSSFDFCSDTQ